MEHKLENAIKHILDGNGVLIFGAGSSYGAKNFADRGIPSGKELMAMFYRECKEDEVDGNLKDAAEVYEEKFHMSGLITKLRNTFRVKSVKPYHEVIFDLDWLRLYTTNYDEVPLIAAQKKGRRLTPVSLGMSYANFRSKRDICLHINGYIGNLNDKNFHDEFKLSTTSYWSTENILKSQWNALFQDDLATAKTVIILGLSLEEDLDLARIIHNSNIFDKTIIIDAPGIKGAKARTLEKIGFLQAIGIEKFAEFITNVSSTYTPIRIEDDDYLYSCFSRDFHKSYPLESPDDNTVIDFFINGNFNDKLTHEKDGSYDCVVERDCLKSLLESIKSRSRLIFLHSKLGNGKTTIVNQLKHYLARENINIFEFLSHHQSVINEEILKICKLSTHCVVIIEDYYSYLHILKIFARYCSDNITFILTARTSLYENKYSEVCDMFSVKEIDASPVNVNVLSDDELKKCRKIFTEFGLFRQDNAKNVSQKRKLLSNTRYGNSEFQSILLEIVRSHDIATRLRDTLSKIRQESESFYDALLLSLIAKVLALKLSLDDIFNISEISSYVKFKNSNGVKEFISFDDNKNLLRINSAVTARMTIKELCDLKNVIDILLKTASYAAKYNETEKYDELLRSIISYSALSSLFSDTKLSKSFFLNYFERLGKLDCFSRNHFFWLQYAIACIEFSSYKRAQIYLDNAYGFAPDGFEPFQINNQQALLFLKMIEEGESSSILADFQEAHALLMKKIVSKKDKEYYVIKLFSHYHRIKNKFISDAEKDIFKQCCQEAYNRLTKFLRSNPNEYSNYSVLKDNLFTDAYSS